MKQLATLDKKSNDWKSRSTRTGGIFIDMVTKYQNYVKNKVLSKAAFDVV